MRIKIRGKSTGPVLVRCEKKTFKSLLDESFSSPEEDEEIWIGNIDSPPVGLANCGNTCYINASFQLLLCIPEMNVYFLRKEYEKYKYAKKLPGFAVCKAISEAYERYFQIKPDSWYDPKSLVDIFHDKDQQDSHEFLYKKLIPRVQNETSPKEQLTKYPFLDNKKAWKFYTSNSPSIFDKLFGGQYKSIIRCHNCHMSSVTYAEFIGISVSISRATLEDCLKSEFVNAAISHYECNSCHKIVNANLKTEIDKCPKYLILHLKRLISKESKIDKHVPYSNIFDISQYNKKSNKINLDFAQRKKD